MVESGNGNVQTDATSGTPVHTSNVMESPNSISSVDMNNQQVQQVQHQQYAQSASDGMNMQVVQQQQPLQQQQQQQQQQNLMPQASPHGSTVMTAPSPAPSVSSSTNQGPPTGGGQGGQGGVHAPSLPSQSPHSQHNMTSPHPQPSPHQTSPHPMTISPAAHSPYQQQQQPQPQPSPQPSQGAQQQQVPGSNPAGSVAGRQSVQPEQRSPHGQQLQYAQQHQHPAQMHHLQQHMSRFYGHYPNYAAAAAMTQNPHHLGRTLQAAGMASMFPPNPMFNLHAPTTPPKQSSQSSRSVPGSNPQYTPTTTAAGHRSATSLARLQQLTNGLENTPGATGSGASVVTSGGNTSAGNTIPGAKPSKQNSALLAPSYYPPATPGQVQAGQTQSAPGHHPNTPGVPGSIPSHPAGRPETPASRNHQNLIAHQYSAQNHMALNYPGYPPGYLNPWNMYHQAAADAHHQRSVSAAAAHHQATHSGVPGSNPAAAPHHHAHQMYPGYPGLPGYNYHR